MKNKINFNLFSSASLISLTGSAIQTTAVPLYVLDKTGSGTIMGSLVFLSMIVSLLVMPLAGVLGDRFSRKKMMVTADIIRGILTLGLALLAFSDKMNIASLFIYASISAVFSGMYTACDSAIITELVEKKELVKANSVMGAVNSISSIAGPVLGGLAYGVGGISIIFLFNGASFLISALLEILMRYTGISGTKKLTAVGFFHDAQEGFRFISSTKPLLFVCIFAMLLNLFFIPIAAIFIPMVLKSILCFSSAQYGLIQSFLTVGILSGNLFMIYGLKRLSFKMKIKTGLFIRAIGTVLLGVSSIPFMVGLLGNASFKAGAAISCILFITGLASAFIDIPFQTILQNLIPNELRSRVFSSIGTMLKIIVPLGIALYGFLADRIPIYALLLEISTASFILTLIFIFKTPKQVYELI